MQNNNFGKQKRERFSEAKMIKRFGAGEKIRYKIFFKFNVKIGHFYHTLLNIHILLFNIFLLSVSLASQSLKKSETGSILQIYKH